MKQTAYQLKKTNSIRLQEKNSKNAKHLKILLASSQHHTEVIGKI